MLVIRLRRTGSKKRPFFRVVVADSRTARESRFVEVLGYYNPRTKPETLRVDRERLDSGLSPNCPVRAQDLAGAFPQFAGLWGARLEGFEPPTRGLGNRIGPFVGVSGG